MERHSAGPGRATRGERPALLGHRAPTFRRGRPSNRAVPPPTRSPLRDHGAVPGHPPVGSRQHVGGAVAQYRDDDTRGHRTPMPATRANTSRATPCWTGTKVASAMTVDPLATSTRLLGFTDASVDIAPTRSIHAGGCGTCGGLAVATVGYDKWLRFVWPLLLVLFAVAAAGVGVAAALG